jgi:serine/threonine protein kinase
MRPGQILGRYEVQQLIARGGMAEVWLALSRGVGGFKKKVVLKTILPDLAENPDFVRMFINEALLAARLHHPNVVQIFDLGNIGETYYIAMELVFGRTLRQIYRACKQRGELMPPWMVLRSLAAVCDALEYANALTDEEGRSLDLVHRDVTPENIMVSFMGTVKVLDFGVAKATAVASLTKAGALKGKYAYMAPEQVQGDPADHRSDIYSVGVVLYELLTGSRPFEAENDLALLRKVSVGVAAPPRAVAPWIPEPLERIILRAMAPDPTQRYQEARDVAAELNALLEATGDKHSAGELGLMVSALFPDDPNIPTDILRRMRGGAPLVAASLASREHHEKASGDETVRQSNTLIQRFEVTDRPDDAVDARDGEVSIDAPTVTPSARPKREARPPDAAPVPEPRPRKGHPRRRAAAPLGQTPLGRAAAASMRKKVPEKEPEKAEDKEAEKAQEKQPGAGQQAKPAPPEPAEKQPAPRPEPRVEPSPVQEAAVADEPGGDRAAKPDRPVLEDTDRMAALWQAASARKPPKKEASEPDIVSPIGLPTQPGSPDLFEISEIATRRSPEDQDSDIFTAYTRQSLRAREDQDSDIFTAYSRSGQSTPGSSDIFSVAARSRDAASSPEIAAQTTPTEAPVSSAEDLHAEAARHFELGLRSFRAGRFHAALDSWQLALSLDPDNRVYASNIRKLKSIIERESSKGS